MNRPKREGPEPPVGHPMNFKGGLQSSDRRTFPERKDSSDVSGVSMKSDHSMGHPLDIRDGPKREGPEPPGPSGVSMKSDHSMGHPLDIRDGTFPERKDSSDVSGVSMKSDHSMGYPLDIRDGFDRDEPEMLSGRSGHQNPTDLDVIFKLLEENIFTFVTAELRRIHAVLRPHGRACSAGQREDEEGEDEEQTRSSREAFLKITLHVLARMKQEQLADVLYSKTVAPTCRTSLKSSLKKKYQHLFEGIPKAGNPTLLKQIYTEIFITEGGSGEVNAEHEVRHIQAAPRKATRPETTIRHEDVFKLPPGREEPVRTVVTKGVAGIGKTVLTQKFTLDWAEGRANQDIQFLFPFTFRELNVLREREFSLVGLVHHFFPETTQICRFQELRFAFIFDGLDESRLPLDFHSHETLTDVSEPASVAALLTNLVRGKLLPSARLWITTRPAAANQIPPDCVDMLTEVRGFTDLQKEEYFRKRFGHEKKASRIISHIETSRSLHIMCHIPVFCWITASVLEEVLKTRKIGELPKTLTEMYIHFLVVQAKLKRVKYDGGAETDPHWSPASRRMMESLGKLAFEQLQKGNLIFYESDLAECGIDVTAASVYSGVFTQIFRQEHGLYQDRVFCFVHLSVQEFLAALYIHMTFVNSGVNLLDEPRKTPEASRPRRAASPETLFYRSAVMRALQSPNGHLDLFLRFLLGLSQPSNQALLRGLLARTRAGPRASQETVRYIKWRIEKNPSAEKCISLFHCLNELDDRSLVEDIQQALASGGLGPGELSPAKWSALVFLLLSSEKYLDVFDLRKYSASEEALLKLLPVVKASNKALLSGCNLSEVSCAALSSVLSSRSCSLTELDLSNNDLRDSGVQRLCDGLQRPQCKLESLRLSGCLITEEGVSSLASALTCNPSHLRELDLSYNHPGGPGLELLSAGRKDPLWGLETLRVDHAAAWTLTTGLRKYAREITLDPNSAHGNLEVSDDCRRVTVVKEQQEQQPQRLHPKRFQHYQQLLCRAGLSSRCYWEVRWEGMVSIAATYRGIGRGGEGLDCLLGGNRRSWGLYCVGDDCFVFHNNEKRDVPALSSGSSRVGVYLDWSAGTLSFYVVSSDSLVHLHTFSTTFTEPLYPAFRVGFQPSQAGSSVSLCAVAEVASVQETQGPPEQETADEGWF
ncbi:NLR family CARD domain-containing protein 3-like [Cololabis saira]|uniref:NLR family CARD domain-containing protein 3-like n=1 Tax=Cololabis saira TaxID=129043 RepID=UPI002AD2A626|nr:NLR family CARD domain-containing protein 3-like [Cololabis saira]